MTLKPAEIDGLEFSKAGGLLPAVVQDAASGAVLMLGYMDRDALEATLERRRVVFFSRSKGRLWEKGETSGHYLELVDLAADCDRDTLLVLAKPQGPVCHVGTRTCFGDEHRTGAERIGFLLELESVIERRIAEGADDSYTARLFGSGAKRVAQKVGEEGLEVALAAAAGSEGEVVSESADLLFHLLVLLRSRGLKLEAIVAELESRHVAKA